MTTGTGYLTQVRPDKSARQVSGQEKETGQRGHDNVWKTYFSTKIPDFVENFRENFPKSKNFYSRKCIENQYFVEKFCDSNIFMKKHLQYFDLFLQFPKIKKAIFI